MEELLSVLIADPENTMKEIQEGVDKYMPLLRMVGRIVLNVYGEYVGCDELFERNAELQKKKYDAYLKVGFSEDQAMELLIDETARLSRILQSTKASAKVSTN